MPEYWAQWCMAEPSTPSGFAFTFDVDLAREATEDDRSLLASQLGPIEARCCGDRDVRVTGTTTDGFFSLKNILHPFTAVELRKTPGKGRGLFASKKIRAGSLIFGEYPYGLAFQELSLPNEEDQTRVFESQLEDFNVANNTPEEIPVDRFQKHTSAILCDSCFCPVESGEQQLQHMRAQLGTEEESVLSKPVGHMLQIQNNRENALDLASFRTLFAPSYCSAACRDAAVCAHAPMLYPSRQNWPTKRQPSMIGDVMHSDQIGAVSTLVLNCSLLQWTTGLRAFRLVSTLLSRLRFASNASANLSPSSWWSCLDSKDWAFALAPWDAFDRPSYTAKTEGEALGILLSKKKYSQPLVLPSTAVEPVSEGMFQDYFDEDPDGPACAVHMLWLLQSNVVDLLVDPTGDSRPSATLLPLELLDRLLGLISTNTQVVGSVPMQAGGQRMPEHVQEWTRLHPALQGNKELAASGLQSGLFPWHAMLNHSCKPNAQILPALDTPLLAALTEQPALPKVLSPCVFVVSTRDIYPGEEITISYADELTPDPVAYKQATTGKARAKQQAQEAALAETVKQRFGWTCRCAVCLKKK